MPATPAKKAPAKKAPAKRAPARKAAPAAVQFPEFPAPAAGSSRYNLGAEAVSDFYDLRVPSGSLCQVRRPGVAGLIEAGVLDSMDSLTSLVQTELIEPGSAAGKKAVEDFSKKPEEVVKGLQMISRLVCWVVVQPALFDPQGLKPEGMQKELDAGKIPVNRVSMLDQIFIMNWSVGGSADITAFRSQFGEFVDDLDSLQGLSVSA